MNKKILAIFVILTLVSFVIPVMGMGPNKVPVNAVITFAEVTNPPDVRITDDGVLHITNMVMEGTIEIVVDGDTENPILVYFVDDPCEGTYSPSADRSALRFDEVWSIDDEPAFVGTDHLQLDGNLLGDWYGMKTHIVLHGIGDYEGQVLNLKMGHDPDVYGFEGTWLKP